MKKTAKKGFNKWFGFLLVFFTAAAYLFSGCGLAEQYETVVRDIVPEIKKELQKVSVTESTEERDEREEAVLDTEALPKETKQEVFVPAELSYEDNYVYLTLEEDVRQVYREVLAAVLGHQEKTDVSTLDKDVLDQAYKAVFADYGGLFWVSGYVYTQHTQNGTPVRMEFAPKYTMEQEMRQQYQAQIDASVQELLSGILATASDYEKAKYVFEMLVWNVDYDAASENNQNIISAFLNRATVCQGYACATQYLLRQLGIQSAIVSGIANGEPHAWNLVRLDGAYYYMDTTWGNSRYLDSSSQEEKHVNYNYLAVTSDEINKTHRQDNSFLVPECTSMQDNYFVVENRYFSEWDPDRIGTLLAEAWNGGSEEVSFKFASEELYDQALQYFITEQHFADYCEGISSIYYMEDRAMRVLTCRFPV